MRCDVFAGTLQWTPTTCPACPCVLELSLRIPLCLSLRFSFSFSLLLGSCTCNHRTDMCKQDNVHDQLQDEVSHQEHTTTCPPPPSAQVHAPLSTSLSLSQRSMPDSGSLSPFVRCAGRCVHRVRVHGSLDLPSRQYTGVDKAVLSLYLSLGLYSPSSYGYLIVLACTYVHCN